ncbi:MAG: hypothetical protein U7123_18800 [Potamolinea sp.]
MNRDTLTLLGCSGSLAFMLLTSNAVKADTLAPQYLDFVKPETNVSQTVVTPVNQENPQSSLIDVASDTVGDLAIDQLGCDCSGCRNTVLQKVQSGNLTVPQQSRF